MWLDRNSVGRTFHVRQAGNQKTLTPGPRTPTTDRINGLLRRGPRTTPTDPSADHPPNKIKNKIKISLTACPIDHSCQRNFPLYAGLRWVNVTDLGLVSGASYVIIDHYIFAIFVAVALHERPGSLRNQLRFLPLPHFLRHPLAASRARPSIRPSSLVSRHGWTVRTDEYESLSFVLFFYSWF